MKLFDFYLFKNLFIATVFVGLVLTVVIFLTQSLRFLELVIDSGASSFSFWILTFLAIPRFFEMILPLSLMAGTLFVYNRMIMDSELIAMRAVGFSPLILSRSAILLAFLATVFLWSMAFWFVPKASSGMQEMRQVIKAQFSNFLFREGVFNRVGDGLTVYVRERTSDGEMHGLMIHDAREKNKNPSTVIAKKGILVAADEAHEVLVYEGSRQEFDKKTQTLNRLNFDRYRIELPNSSPVSKRWAEPDERTLFELLRPNLQNERDVASLREFKVEIHKRLAAPLLALAYTLIACTVLLLGPVDRRGQTLRITAGILTVMVIQGLFLAAFNIARESDGGLFLMYGLVLLPIMTCLIMLWRSHTMGSTKVPPVLEVVS